ncbi:hypothetical protein JCM8202_005443 [Rhodotorula sphaerocarpa]
MNAPARFANADPMKEGNMYSKEMEAYEQPHPEHLHSSDKVSLAEYFFWAERQRERERNDNTPTTAALTDLGRTLKGKITKFEKSADDDSDPVTTSVEPYDALADASGDLVGLSEYEVELCNARRALRVAGWSSIFYLITTDILGPFNAPYAIANMGMAPGVILYVVFGAAAFWTGCMLNWQFLQLDSIRFPIRTFGDLGGRLLGTWMRHLCSFLQAVQLVLNVGLIQLSNGQSLAQMVVGSSGTGHICFSVAVVIWCFLGIIIGQIRTLRGLGPLANVAVFLNLSIIFISMGMFAHTGPNIAAAKASYGSSLQLGPVSVTAVVNQPVFAQVNGLMNMVFAYGGAMIFPELMTEMRRPHDFIKGMALAQAVIITAYLMYGIYVYALQGQYTLALAYQGLNNYVWQTVCNAIALVTGAIAAALYGNIGLKVLYINIIEGFLKGPPLMSKKGRIIWGVSVIVFWGAAFCIGSGIPSVGTLSGLVAAICIFQFSYTFPPLFQLALEMHKDAMAADDAFETPGIVPRRADTWKNWSRWRRGFFGGSKKRVALKSLYFFFFLGALATAGLGMWASGTDLRHAINAGAASSFGCTAPV